MDWLTNQRNINQDTVGEINKTVMLNMIQSNRVYIPINLKKARPGGEEASVCPKKPHSVLPQSSPIFDGHVRQRRAPTLSLDQ